MAEIIGVTTINSIQLGGFILVSLFKGLLMLFTLIPFEKIRDLINLINTELIKGLATGIGIAATLFEIKEKVIQMI